jgi:hypothetical protein
LTPGAKGLPRRGQLMSLPGLRWCQMRCVIWHEREGVPGGWVEDWGRRVAGCVWIRTHREFWGVAPDPSSTRQPCPAPSPHSLPPPSLVSLLTSPWGPCSPCPADMRPVLSRLDTTDLANLAFAVLGGEGAPKRGCPTRVWPPSSPPLLPRWATPGEGGVILGDNGQYCRNRVPIGLIMALRQGGIFCPRPPPYPEGGPPAVSSHTAHPGNAV